MSTNYRLRMLRVIENLVQQYKQSAGSYGDVPSCCEFCGADPDAWIKVGGVVTFVCESHLKEFLNALAAK